MADDTKSRLAAAAASLVAESGWRSATSRAIAERASANPALVNYYFGSKDELLMHALATAMASMEADFEALLRLNSLTDFIGACTEYGAREAESEPSRVLLEATMQATRDPVVGKAIRTQLQAFRVLLAMRCREAVSSGTIDSTADPEGLAIALSGLLDGLLLHRLIDPQTDLDAAGKAIVALLKPR